MTIDFIINLLTVIFFDTNIDSYPSTGLWTWSYKIHITGLNTFSYALLAFGVYKAYTWFKAHKSTN